MRQKSVIDQAAFDRLLLWLGPDRDKAAQKYEVIRRRLVEIFASRGFADAESLADETVDRVMLRVEKVSDGWVGDPAYFFLGVAKKIMLERSRPPRVIPPPTPPDGDENDRKEREDRCLERCLGLLSENDRKMILEYVDGRKQEHHEQAKKLGITPNALRIRVHQTKKVLRPCIKDCLEE